MQTTNTLVCFLKVFPAVAIYPLLKLIWDKPTMEESSSGIWSLAAVVLVSAAD